MNTQLKKNIFNFSFGIRLSYVEKKNESDNIKIQLYMYFLSKLAKIETREKKMIVEADSSCKFCEIQEFELSEKLRGGGSREFQSDKLQILLDEDLTQSSWDSKTILSPQSRRKYP